MTLTVNDLDPTIRELIKKAAGGHEVIFTDGEQPIARIVPVISTKTAATNHDALAELDLPALHLGPALSNFTKGEIADEMFGA
jgi:antitoxin (DNA-binding transcriptional repressor) of toxin-antitoxin stability system